MSTATATAAAPKQGKKKLIIIILVAVIGLVVVGGGAAVFLLKKPAAEHDEYADEEAIADEGGAAVAAPKVDPKKPPAFVPLDTFTVNLADRDAERFAQVGITLEVPDAATADIIKAFMPAVRNNILLAIADRTSAELLQRDGKTQLAQRVLRETSRALGYDVAEPEPAEASEATPGADDEVPKKKRRKPKAVALPVTAVHFSNFIIQ
jgi:flagellar FliL protein